MKKHAVLWLLLAILMIALFVYLRYRHRSLDTLSAGLVRLAISSPADALPADTFDQYLEKEGFVLAYSESYEQPAWVSYILTRRMVLLNVAEREDQFREDTLVREGSASPSDYTRSGFDRGHMAPAGDMGWSARAMKESFLMSNISPQAPGLNRGLWRSLEEQVRTWAMEEESLLVVTGPVLHDVDTFIGRNRVGIPPAFFKAIVDLSPPDVKAIAFLMPNRPLEGPLFRYAIPVDSLEKVLNTNLFYRQDPRGMERLEADISLEKWR